MASIINTVQFLDITNMKLSVNQVSHIIDIKRNFDGFFILDENSQLGRFAGYYVANSIGNTERYDAYGNFDGFIVPNDNIIKFDKSGTYQGYYEISPSGYISEFDKSGQYIGHYKNEDDGKIIKFDASGSFQLYFGE